MTTPIYTSPFTGTVVTPTDVSYLALTLTANTQLYWPATVNPPQVAAPRIMDVTAPTAALSILLPDASQGTVGTDILIRNYGPAVFTVTDATGAQSVTIAVGAAQYFYLADNTTVAGIWHSVAFGAGTSYADAAALAGPGLIALNGMLSTTATPIEISSPIAITNANRANTFIWTGGASPFVLPDPSTLTQGWYILFRNNGTGTLTLVTPSPSLINGGANVPTNPGDSGLIVFEQSSGNYFTVGLANPTNVTFTANTYDVDSIIGSTFSLVSYAPIIQTYVAQSGVRTTNLEVILPQITQMYILVNATNQTGYDMEFLVEGSLIAPVTISSGQTVLAFTDGTNLYVLSQQSSSGQYFANNGSASAPSFSFTNDSSTGMYLAGTDVLGLAANGTNIMTLNASTLGSLQITTPATFNAALITGGSF